MPPWAKIHVKLFCIVQQKHPLPLDESARSPEPHRFVRR